MGLLTILFKRYRYSAYIARVFRTCGTHKDICSYVRSDVFENRTPKKRQEYSENFSSYELRSGVFMCVYRYGLLEVMLNRFSVYTRSSAIEK